MSADWLTYCWEPTGIPSEPPDEYCETCDECGGQAVANTEDSALCEDCLDD